MMICMDVSVVPNKGEGEKFISNVHSHACANSTLTNITFFHT